MSIFESSSFHYSLALRQVTVAVAWAPKSRQNNENRIHRIANDIVRGALTTNKSKWNFCLPLCGLVSFISDVNCNHQATHPKPPTSIFNISITFHGGTREFLGEFIFIFCCCLFSDEANCATNESRKHSRWRHTLMGARSSADEVERILFFSTSGSDFDGFDNVHLVFMYH